MNIDVGEREENVDVEERELRDPAGGSAFSVAKDNIPVYLTICLSI